MSTLVGDAPIIPEPAVPVPKTRPILFFVLFLPFGISSGYIGVTLIYLLSQAGISVMAVAGLAALNLMPQNIRFLWAPIIDTTLSGKKWFVLAVVAEAAVLAGMALVPMTRGNLLVFQALVLALATVVTFNVMAADLLMAHATTPADKGRAGGWSQAGNLGGTGLGGGAGLWIATHVHHAWVPGAVLGLACIACCFVLPWVDDPGIQHKAQSYLKNLAQVGRECWEMLSSRLGFLALFIMLIPIGSGAAGNLWSAIAGEWHAGADMVALVNGVLSGVASIVGAIIGGFLSDRLDRKTAYYVFGLVVVTAAVGMALAPRTPAMFAVFVLAYSFSLGLCWAAYAAVTLEAIGTGAAATKFNVISGLSNLPLTYMALIDGWAQTKFGSSGMLYIESTISVAAIVLYLAVATFTRGRFRREKPAYAGV